MKILRVSSLLQKAGILEKCKSLGVAAFSPSLAGSEEQIRLAALLAEKSFAGKSNLAKTMELEFLLWLCGENDLRKAFAKNDFSPRDFLLVSFGDAGKKALLEALSAKERPLSLRKKADALELEGISLGRL
ncbi:Uncharacterised protein [uncultured archaeon]|nr:Uncharacterised protein [uncultured archaeon]